MIIHTGSKNPNKLKAVKEAFSHFSQFSISELIPMDAPSGVSDQPIGYEETVRGAKNRAKNAFTDCDLSIGLESGLIPVAGTSTGYLNMTVAALYDGSHYFVGTGPGFELPSMVTRLVVDEGLELDEAILRSGLSDNPRIGYSEGIIGVMTDGIITRKDYMVPAVMMALAGYMSGLEF